MSLPPLNLRALQDDARRLWPVWGIGAAALVGTILYAQGADAARWILERRDSAQYVLLSPFLHGGLAHFLLNFLALRFLGEGLLRTIGARRFFIVFAAGAAAATLANGVFSDARAVGMSGAVFAALGAALYPFGQTPVKLLFIHDLLRLRPFRLQSLALFLVGLDVCGIIFNWGYFSHWGHLGGMLCGLVLGRLFFPGFRPFVFRR